MSNNTTTGTVPVINPDAYPQLVEMLKDSLRRHNEELELAEALIETIETEGVGDLSRAQDDVVCSALQLLICKKEEDIAVTQTGIDELSGAIG